MYSEYALFASAYGSWPTWWGAFDPYGAEIDTNVTTNNYKFSGMERDAQTGESGLDNFGARSYSSNLVGKFMQTDPAGLASVNLWNSLSFYRYGYAMNNPLSLIDPTGLDCVYFNDSGTGVESVDPDDNEGNPSGECSDNGGDYVNGHLTGANYFASSDSWTLNSASGSNTYTLYASAPARRVTVLHAPGHALTGTRKIAFLQSLHQRRITTKVLLAPQITQLRRLVP